LSLLYIHYLTTCICLYIYTACLQQYSRNHGNSVSLFKYITDLFVYGMRHTALWSCSHIPNIIDLSQKKKCYGPDKKILFKKQLFDREVKVPRRSLRYATHRLMVMHPHTKYHWPIWKDKNVMARTRKYYLKNNIWPWGQGPTKVITVCDTPPYGHALTYQIYLTYLERQKSYGPDKLRWEEAEEAEEKIRLKQYVSLRSIVRRGDIIINYY
jgi:hypothetical protein